MLLGHAYGLPVLATAVGTFSAEVRDGVDGLLVPPDDPTALAEAINTLTRDTDRAKAMGAAGRERAKTLFDWGRIAEQTAELYRTVVAAGR